LTPERTPPMPKPQAEVITLSENQQKILTALARRRTNPHQLVRRAQLILQASAGKNNSQISWQLQLHRHQVRLWRKRWQQAQESLKQAETEGDNTFLEQRICKVLSDEFRSGTPATFSIEQIVQIIAIACEDPRESGYPISHWTPKEIALEAIKREIVAEISPRSVGRFLCMKRPYSLIVIAIGSTRNQMTLMLFVNKSETSVSCTKGNTDDVKERHLQIMNKRNQTRIRNGFTLIVDASGHRKSGATPRLRKAQGSAHQDSGNFTDGVGRQYIGEIGKTENGIVTVTTHLYDGVRSLPLDIELSEHADSLPEGKKDKDFVKKPDLALKLIKKTIKRKFCPGIRHLQK